MFTSKKSSFILYGTILLCTMMLCRIIATGHYTYLFLGWNIFLAYLPLCIAYTAKKYSLKSWKLLMASFCWFIFFPNAPYVITDLMHISNLHDAPYWYDTLMLFTAAATGIALAFTSLQLMENQWRIQWGIKFFSNRSYRVNLLYRLITVLIIFLFTGFGIYLGRELRYNSWDIITDTGGLAFDIKDRVFNPFAYKATWGFTFFYAAALFMFYNAWCGLPGLKSGRK